MSRPASVVKPGRDVTVGDVLRDRDGRFLVLGFAVHKPGSRLALNCWAEGRVVFDDRPTAVLGRQT